MVDLMDISMTARNTPRRSRIHPQKFALYLAMASIIMMFMALTSAYVVRKAAGNWLEFRLPTIFFVNTVVLLASSLTAHLSYRSLLKEAASAYRSYTILTFVLGVVFLVLQVIGWQQLFQIGVPLDGNPSGSFIYVISGIHGAHVIGGLVALFIALWQAFKPFALTDRRKRHAEMVNVYWHFVDILWLYLIIFLILQ